MWNHYQTDYRLSDLIGDEDRRAFGGATTALDQYLQATVSKSSRRAAMRPLSDTPRTRLRRVREILIPAANASLAGLAARFERG
jgi:hypothetical protein